MKQIREYLLKTYSPFNTWFLILYPLYYGLILLSIPYGKAFNPSGAIFIGFWFHATFGLSSFLLLPLCHISIYYNLSRNWEERFYFLIGTICFLAGITCLSAQINLWNKIFTYQFGGSLGNYFSNQLHQQFSSIPFYLFLSFIFYLSYLFTFSNSSEDSETFSTKKSLFPRKKLLKKEHLPSFSLLAKKDELLSSTHLPIQTLEKLKETLKKHSLPYTNLKEIEPSTEYKQFLLPVENETEGTQILAYTEKLSLHTPGLRILFPYPNEKDTVAFQVPSFDIQRISYKELVQPNEKFKEQIPWILGFQKNGERIVLDLKTPTLITGASNMGQVQLLNSLLLSLLMQKTSTEVKIILCDIVQNLECNDKEPHFLSPIIQTPLQIENLFKWLIQQKEPPQEDWIILINGYESVPSIFPQLQQLLSTPENKIIPFLISNNAYPNVITEELKDLYPCRICLKVTSALDSRTILNRNGAEHLKGIGDFYLLLKDEEELVQGQSLEVSFAELNRIQDYWSQQNSYQWLPELEKLKNQQETVTDPYMDKAVRLVLSTQRISSNMLMNRLQIDSQHADALLKRMEQEKIIEGQGKTQNLLISLEDWEKNQ